MAKREDSKDTTAAQKRYTDASGNEVQVDQADPNLQARIDSGELREVAGNE